LTFLCLAAIASAQTCPSSYDSTKLPDFANICVNVTALLGINPTEVIGDATSSALESVIDVDNAVAEAKGYV
jgi:hypothetical protein